MSKFIITYDLCNNSKNYQKLYDYFDNQKCCKVTESSVLISTNKGYALLRDELSTLVDADDRIFVAGLDGTAAWKNVICGSIKVKDTL